MSRIKLEVERDAGVAYVTLSEMPVARTVEHSSAVLVDLDSMNVAVGIELLDLDASIPFADLIALYHVDSSVVETLRVIEPTINKFMQKTKSLTEEGVVQDSLPTAHANQALV